MKNGVPSISSDAYGMMSTPIEQFTKPGCPSMMFAFLALMRATSNQPSSINCPLATRRSALLNSTE